MISLITLDELGFAISDMVDEYAQEVILRLEKKLDETANEIVKYIKSKHQSGGSKPLLIHSLLNLKGSGM